MSRALALLAAVAACADPPPCDAVSGACIELTVESSVPDVAIDEIDLGITFGTTQRRASTRVTDSLPFEMPAIIAIGIPLGPADATVVDLVIGGSGRAETVGAAAASVPLEGDEEVAVTVRLTPREECVDGGHYCGGDRLLGNPAFLYTCSALGVPRLYEQCELGCVVAPAGSDDYCRAP